MNGAKHFQHTMSINWSSWKVFSEILWNLVPINPCWAGEDKIWGKPALYRINKLSLSWDSHMWLRWEFKYHCRKSRSNILVKYYHHLSLEAQISAVSLILVLVPWHLPFAVNYPQVNPLELIYPCQTFLVKYPCQLSLSSWNLLVKLSCKISLSNSHINYLCQAKLSIMLVPFSGLFPCHLLVPVYYLPPPCRPQSLLKKSHSQLGWAKWNWLIPNPTPTHPQLIFYPCKFLSLTSLLNYLACLSLFFWFIPCMCHLLVVVCYTPSPEGLCQTSWLLKYPLQIFT